MLRGAVKIAVISVIVYYVVGFLFKLGLNVHYKKHHPGQCRQVKGLDFGAEDFQVTKTGQAFISSGFSFSGVTPAFKEFIAANEIRGRIFLFNFNQPEKGAIELKLKPSKDFNPETLRPHGLSLLEDDVKGEHLIYVISHPEHEEADKVEKFRFLPKTNELVHLKSFSGDELLVTNDLTVVEEDKFYISNSQYFRRTLGAFFEMLLLPFSLGSVVFYDGSDFVQMLPGMNAPNGLALSKDGRYLYVNLLLSRTMNVYERNLADNSLTLIQTIPLYAMGDNFHLSQTGDALYTGVHPLLHKSTQHLGDPTIPAPSSILKLPLQDGKVVEEDITELFYDHGDLISGSSVGMVYNNKLLIGSIIHKLVLCDGNLKL